MITGTYNLVAQPSWAAITFQEVRLECDTTLAPVVINLPEISELAQATNLKLFIVDASGNASTNNITINAGGSDTFDNSTTTQLVLNTDGSSVLIQNVSATQWLATESSSGIQPSYKVYTALLTQTGTNPPVATILENNLGNITFGYTSPGNYTINSSSLFEVNKTFILNQSYSGYDNRISVVSTYINNSQIFLSSLNLGIANNGLIYTPTSIEIRVYN